MQHFHNIFVMTFLQMCSKRTDPWMPTICIQNTLLVLKNSKYIQISCGSVNLAPTVALIQYFWCACAITYLIRNNFAVLTLQHNYTQKHYIIYQSFTDGYIYVWHYIFIQYLSFAYMWMDPHGIYFLHIGYTLATGYIFCYTHNLKYGSSYPIIILQM